MRRKWHIRKVWLGPLTTSDGFWVLYTPEGEIEATSYNWADVRDRFNLVMLESNID